MLSGSDVLQRLCRARPIQTGKHRSPLPVATPVGIGRYRPEHMHTVTYEGHSVTPSITGQPQICRDTTRWTLKLLPGLR